MTMQTENVRQQAGASVTPIASFRNLTGSALSGIRQIYDSVPGTRETLGVLFAVDAAQTNPTEAWIGFFVETAASQLIWDERPTGTLSAEAAAWVLGRFDTAPTVSILALLVRLTEEAQRLPADFAGEVRRRARRFVEGLDRTTADRPRRTDVPYLRLVA